MKNNLKKLRKARGVTQKKMAADLGVAESTVQNWESDRTDMTGWSLVMVAEYLGVPPDAVYGNRPSVEYAVVKMPSGDEDELLELYRSCSKAGRSKISDYASMVAAMESAG